MKKYRYQLLEEELTGLIRNHKFEAHDLLPSYSDLRERYGHSIATVTRAFDSMEKKGLIYSVHGKGTFVSPPVRSRKILILYPGDGLYRDSALFLDGAQKFLFRHNRSYLPMLLPLKLIREDPDNLTYTYPDIRGIIVFRDFAAYRELEPICREKDIALMFYGSSFHNVSPIPNSYIYDEKAMACAAVEHLRQRGYEEAGVFVPRFGGLGRFRCEMFRREAERGGIAVTDKYIYRGDEGARSILEWLRERVWKGMPLYTVHGRHTILLYHLLMQAPLSVPEEVGLLGVDRTELSALPEGAPAFVDLPTSQDGARCVSLLIDLMENRAGSVRGTSQISIVPGETLL